MPGRNKSPVQQAWEYVIDAPGAKWVLVSNCAEIRLYAFGHGRELYETWDLGRLDDPQEHERLWLLIGAQNFLTGRTAALLDESASEQKDITGKLHGSGAFLIAASGYLAGEYKRVAERLSALGDRIDASEVDREILAHNLHGVDLNPEPVELTKLSLWLKMAKRGKLLQDLDASIKCGNSLIADKNEHGRAFDWQAELPGIFARGGFDIVLGNPPYARMKTIKPFKPYLQKHFAVASGRADLYAYFYEKGLELLRPSGRLGYISSSTFFRTGSGEPLRHDLRRHAEIETVVDFGDLQIFEGVTTYPAIVTMRRASSGNEDGQPG